MTINHIENISDGYETPYQFTGYEKDQETGLLYAGARYYDSRLSTFNSTDPMWYKYPHLSPYAYCANNPLMYVDTDGRKIKFAQGASPEFKAAFKEAIQHLNKHNVGHIAAALEKSKLTFYITETDNEDNKFSYKAKVIYWNPNLVGETNSGIMLSPTTILNHELDHALGIEKASKDLSELMKYIQNFLKSTDEQYETKEERRVITGSEQLTAKALGEIKEGEVTRSDHKMKKFWKAESPISNKPKSTVLPEVEIIHQKTNTEK